MIRVNVVERHSLASYEIRLHDVHSRLLFSCSSRLILVTPSFNTTGSSPFFLVYTFSCSLDIPILRSCRLTCTGQGPTPHIPSPLERHGLLRGKSQALKLERGKRTRLCRRGRGMNLKLGRSTRKLKAHVMDATPLILNILQPRIHGPSQVRSAYRKGRGTCHGSNAERKTGTVIIYPLPNECHE